jgi:hypothetical protein
VLFAGIAVVILDRYFEFSEQLININPAMFKS